MASSASSGVSDSFRRRGNEIVRGIPRKCRCGATPMVKTADTLKNPGRLFYCCQFGSKEDNSHLFKWTDIAMVEEMEDVGMFVEKVQVDVSSLGKGLHDLEGQMDTLACETRTCEVVANSYGTKIEAVKELVEVCEKEIGDLKSMLSCCQKNVEDLQW